MGLIIAGQGLRLWELSPHELVRFEHTGGGYDFPCSTWYLVKSEIPKELPVNSTDMDSLWGPGAKAYWRSNVSRPGYRPIKLNERTTLLTTEEEYLAYINPHNEFGPVSP